MREIKFRAFDKETKEMSHDFMSKNWLRVCIESPYVVLMQYTGLKDRNGADIYEGDIVKAREQSDRGTFTGYVHYLNCQYWVNYLDYESYYVPLIQLHGAVYEPIEVIGNIYEKQNS